MNLSYTRDVYARAKAEIQKRRTQAEEERRIRNDEICEKFPEIIELERQMARAGADSIKAISMGESAEAFIESLSKSNLEAQRKREKILTENGYPADYLAVKYTCPDCEDTGYVGQKYCKCYHDLCRKIALEDISASTPMKLSSFDDFRLDYYPDKISPEAGVNTKMHMTGTLNYCKWYAEKFSTSSDSLLFHGRTGLGKTHLSLAIAAAASEKGFSVIYDSTQNIINKIESEHFSRNTSSADTLSAVCACGLLILDDLGTEFQTAFTLSAMYNIINNRILAHLPTIISTNLDLNQLNEKYGERITSRIAGSYVNIAFFGNDIRQIISVNKHNRK